MATGSQSPSCLRKDIAPALFRTFAVVSFLVGVPFFIASFFRADEVASHLGVVAGLGLMLLGSLFTICALLTEIRNSNRDDAG